MTIKSDSTLQSSSKSTIPSFRFRWKWLFLLLGLIFIFWLGTKAWRIGRAAQELLAQQEVVEALLADGMVNINPDEAEEVVHTVRQNFIVLRDETAFLMPLTPRLGWVPKVGSLLVAAPQLVAMGDAGTETAVHAMDSFKPVLHVLQSKNAEGGQLPQLVSALAEARPGLAEAAISLEKVAAARAEISRVEQFPQRLQPLFVLIDEWLPIAQDSLAVAQILPEIMGLNGRRTYLLLAQNEDELRATGGYISGVGTLTVENGDIQNLTFQNADQFDVQNLIANSTLYEFPPQPLYEIMGAEYLLLRDANYWPDLPYSAQQAINLFRRVEPEPAPDGVIAIDQEFMSLLVAATGPITVQETGQVITARNTLDSFREAFNIQEGQTVREWFRNRKAFLTSFSAAILTKIQSDVSAIDPVTFTKNIHQALDSRHLQLYMIDPHEAAVLDRLNWDGRLENPPGQDFLLVLDTNVGFNKSNMHVQRSIEYRVQLNGTGPADAELTITYNHTGLSEQNLDCVQEISYADAPTYQEIADRCYFNFLRIYTPAGASLNEATRHSIPPGILLGGHAWDKPANTLNEFANFTTFTNLLMVPLGETLSTQFTYQLPGYVVSQLDNQSTYQLYLRKQAGTNTQPVRVSIILPAGSTIADVTISSDAAVLQENNRENNRIEVTLDLQKDTLLTVTYNP